MPTALQIAQARQVPLTQGLIMALVTDTPLLAALQVRTSQSTKFLSLAVKSLPTAGPFVNYNEGFTSSDAGLEVREFDCSLVGGQIKAEVITARKWDREHAATGTSWMGLQTMLKLKAQGIELEKQVIRGTAYDAKGFPGLKELTPYVAANVYALTTTAAAGNFAKSVINAAGSQAGTASSVYALIDGEMDVQLVVGDDMNNGGEFFKLEDPVMSNEAPDSSQSTKKSLHEVIQFSGHLGLSCSGFNQSPNSVVPTQFSVRRLANLTTDSAAKLTDAMMSKLARSFGPGKRPSRFAMATRSGEYLAASRQATAVSFFMGQSGNANAAVANIYPPPPDNWEGIPIHYADLSIGESDTVEA